MTLQDLSFLVRATIRIFREALQRGIRGVRVNWWACFLPIAYLFLLQGVGSIVLTLLGSLLGGFVLGFFSAYLVAHFLSFIEASVEEERLGIRESFSRAGQLFNGVITVLFALFILNFVANAALSSQPFLRGIANLLLVLLFNPISEVVYLRRGDGGFESLFGESLEFMKENAVEWLSAFALLFLPVLLFDPNGFLLIFLQASPMEMGPHFIRAIAETISGTTSVGVFLGVMIALIYTYFVFIFRGALYQGLSQATRRKRIYQERNR